MKQYNSARTYQFRVQLTRDGHRRLDDRLAAHARLYNGAIQERRDAWRMARRSITYVDQSRELTLVRQDDPDWASEHRRVAEGTLRRVDLAFQAFFRRVKAGEAPGYPRFKPRRRFRTLDIYPGADRFVQVNAAGTKAAIRIKGLPAMRLRLHRPLPDIQPKVIRITRTPRRVVASLVYPYVNPELAEGPPELPAGVDAGVARRITISDGRYMERREVDRRKLRRLQRRVSRAKRGSASRRKKVAALAKEWQRIAEHNRGDDHQLAAAIVREYDFIAVEDLKIGNMVRSAAGTIEEPGSNVAAKSGLNRSILDQSWGRLYQKIEYKAARAGIRFVRVPPQHTSQTCSACGAIDAASRRSQVVFHCTSCGHIANADVNAALNILHRGLDVLGLAQCIAKVPCRLSDQPRPLGPVGAVSRDTQGTARAGAELWVNQNSTTSTSTRRQCHGLNWAATINEVPRSGLTPLPRLANSPNGTRFSMQQNTISGRPSASGPPPTVGAIILRWLHDEDRTLAFLVTAASIDADDLIAIITGAIAPSAEHLGAIALATGLDQHQLQQAAAAWSPPHQLHAFTVAQAAQLLQVSDDTIRREMSRGRLGYVVIGERLQRIPWSALEELLNWRGGAA